METQSSPEPQENPRQPLDWLFKLNRQAQELTRSKEEDSTLVLALKVFGKLFLAVLMILLSPILLIGLAIAFAAVL